MAGFEAAAEGLVRIIGRGMWLRNGDVILDETACARDPVRGEPAWVRM